MRVLVIGDIVGRYGRRAVQSMVPQLRKEFNCAFCIANGENMAGGAGLSESGCNDLHAHNVDVVTAGDHVWDQKDFLQQIGRLPNVIRPANLHEGVPGKGYGIFNIPIGGQIAVINLVGRVFMRDPADCPFQCVERILSEIAYQANIIFVDFHAEATSEKLAMGRYLDGRVTCVYGTHTHVPTADEQVLPEGTAYISDIGMVGAERSILGRAVEPVVQRFSTGVPARFDVVNEDIYISGAIIEFDARDGKARSIQRIRRPWQSQ